MRREGGGEGKRQRQREKINVRMPVTTMSNLPFLSVSDADYDTLFYCWSVHPNMTAATRMTITGCLPFIIILILKSACKCGQQLVGLNVALSPSLSLLSICTVSAALPLCETSLHLLHATLRAEPAGGVYCTLILQRRRAPRLPSFLPLLVKFQLEVDGTGWAKCQDKARQRQGSRGQGELIDCSTVKHQPAC